MLSNSFSIIRIHFTCNQRNLSLLTVGEVYSITGAYPVSNSYIRLVSIRERSGWFAHSVERVLLIGIMTEIPKAFTQDRSRMYYCSHCGISYICISHLKAPWAYSQEKRHLNDNTENRFWTRFIQEIIYFAYIVENLMHIWAFSKYMYTPCKYMYAPCLPNFL